MKRMEQGRKVKLKSGKYINETLPRWILGINIEE